MTEFVDPRSDPPAEQQKRQARLCQDKEVLEELFRYCREGRLYEIERWIRAGQPLQLDPQSPLWGKRKTSALETALERGDHALVLLLLCNGYDPNLESHSPLDFSLKQRRMDLVDLLLEWGTDPRSVDLERLFDTYDSALWQRFLSLGVDLTECRAIAYALGYHTSNKPLFGFVRRHRESYPEMQRQLNMALGHHIHEGNEKGVALCLWAGADAHASVQPLRHGYSESSDDEGDGWSAVYEACQAGHVELLKRLQPDPERDDFDDLYRAAPGPETVDALAEYAPPSDGGEVIRHHIWWMTFPFNDRRSIYILEKLFQLGARWVSVTPQEIGNLRRALLKIRDYEFVDLLRLLSREDYCAPEILHELGRTPGMRARMQSVGIVPPSERFLYERPYRPPGSREILAKLGVELPKPKRRLPRTYVIGRQHSGGDEIELTREELFERVWMVPVETVAKEWGLSGPGLAKACRALRIPLPPRGHWAKAKARKRTKRPTLPRLPAGEGEVVVVRIP